MNRPWMPLYIGDYLADTAHLRAAESGAYIHLIMHYWRNDGLPDDDIQLAAIARMTMDEWRSARVLIEPLFKAGKWKHKRIEVELAKARQKVEAGQKGGLAKAKRNPSEPPSEIPSDPPSTPVIVTCEESQVSEVERVRSEDTRARDENVSPLISPEAKILAEQFCEAIRAGPDDLRRNGVAWVAQMWVTRGYDRAAILALGADIAARKGDPPLIYFTKAVERDQEERKKNPQKLNNGGLSEQATAYRAAPGWQQRRDQQHAARAELHAFVSTYAESAESGRCEGDGPPIRVVQNA